MADKKSNEIRQEMKAYRKQLTSRERLEASNKICNRLLEDIISREYQDILCYYPLPYEVDLLPLYELLLSRGYALYFPKTEKEQIAFYEILDLNQFQKGCFDVMEPINLTRPFEKKEGYGIIPGLAFDRTGHRIGYGGGFYDRFLHKNPGIYKTGVAFSGQRYDKIPSQPWDVRMDQVIVDE